LSPKETLTETVSLPLASILPPAARRADAASVAALADSMRVHGLLTPLTVREISASTEPHWCVLDGARRLAAARLLGWREISCVVTDYADAAARSLLEDLTRKRLNLFEQAEAIASLSRDEGWTQEEIASRLCVSQSTVANKLRLLRFLPDERRIILEANLTERHARTLLRLCGDDRLSAIRQIAAMRLNVAETEAYVDALLADDAAKPAAVWRTAADLAGFFASLAPVLERMRQAGFSSVVRRSETPGGVDVTIHFSREP